jgi:hypothetical protein
MSGVARAEMEGAYDPFHEYPRKGPVKYDERLPDLADC